MVSFTTSLPAGIAGEVTRKEHSIIESGLFDATLLPDSFGVAVKINAGKFEKIQAGALAGDVYGYLVRYAPSMSVGLSNDFGSGAPNADYAQGILVSGYLNVICTIGTPSRGGTVYLRVVAATGKAVGDFEASADGTNSVALTNVVWAEQGKDGSNVAEIRVK
jgi:hypothetical protein